MRAVLKPADPKVPIGGIVRALAAPGRPQPVSLHFCGGSLKEAHFLKRATPNIFKPPGLFVHVKRCAEKLRLAILVHFLDSATSALYPGCGAHRGILAFPGPCEFQGDSIHGPEAFRAKWRREGLVRVLFPMGVP